MLEEGWSAGAPISAHEYAAIRNRVGGQKGSDAETIRLFEEMQARQAASAAARSSRSSRLQSQLTGAYDQSTRDIDQAYNSLEALLRGQVNPYEGYQVQAAPQIGGLSELLASQGVSNQPVRELATAFQTQNQGQATAFQNLVNTLGQIYGTSQQGALADVGRMRTESRRNAATNRQELLRLLMQALRGG